MGIDGIGPEIHVSAVIALHELEVEQRKVVDELVDRLSTPESKCAVFPYEPALLKLLQKSRKTTVRSQSRLFRDLFPAKSNAPAPQRRYDPHIRLIVPEK